MSEKKATETTASALLEAVVSAELGLRELEATCASLEDLVTQAHGLLAEARNLAPAAPESAVAKPTVPVLPAEKPTVPEPAVAKRVPEPSPQPVATIAATIVDEPEPEIAPEPAAQEKPANRRSLEEQAAALRAAMESVSKPAGAKPDAESATATKSDSKDADREKKDQPQPLDRRPFQPKRTSPLRSRLAREEDGSPTPQEGESYSDRSAELEQLLRSEQNS
jgi:hypothetical protein